MKDDTLINKTDQWLLHIANNSETSESKLHSLILSGYEKPAIKALESWIKRFNPSPTILKDIYSERLLFAIRQKIADIIISHPNATHKDMVFLITQSEDFVLSDKALKLLQQLNPSIHLLWKLWEALCNKCCNFSEILQESICKMIIFHKDITEEILLTLIKRNSGYFSIDALKIYINRFEAPLEGLQKLQKNIHSLNGVRYPDVYFSVATALINHKNATEKDFAAVIIKNGYEEIVINAWELLKKTSPSLDILWNLYQQYKNTPMRRNQINNNELAMEMNIAMAIINHPDVKEDQLLLIASSCGEQAIKAWGVLQSRFFISTEALVNFLKKPIISELVNDVCLVIISRQDIQEKDLLTIVRRAYDDKIIIQALNKWKHCFNPTEDVLFDYWLNKRGRKITNDWLMSVIKPNYQS